MKHNNTPKIDHRGEIELLRDLSSRIVEHSNAWTTIEGDIAGAISNLQNDPFASAVMMSFLRIFQVMQERLNKVPEKNFMAFLDMLALKMRQPEPARAPISFFLTKGAKRWTVVPEGTQIAGESPEAPDPVVFETIEDIAVILPRPVKAVSVRPTEDMHTVHKNGLFNVDESAIETFFGGLDAMAHRLYLGDASLAELLPGDKITVIIEFNTKTGADSFLAMQKRLLYFHDEEAVFKETADLSFVKYDALVAADREDINAIIKGSSAIALVPEEQNVFVFAAVPSGAQYTSKIHLNRVLGTTALSGSKVLQDEDFQDDFTYEAFEREDAWLAIEVVPGENQIESLKSGGISVKEVTFSYGVAAENSAKPAGMAIANRTRLDLSKDFFPFGLRPKFNDTFYLSCEELFAKEEGSLDIQFTLSEAYAIPEAGTNAAPELIWEYHGENGWQEISWKLDREKVTATSSSGDTHTVTVTETFTDPGNQKLVSQIETETVYVTVAPMTKAVTVTNLITGAVSVSAPVAISAYTLPEAGTVNDEVNYADITVGLTLDPSGAQGEAVSDTHKTVQISLEIDADAAGTLNNVKFAPVKINGQENLWMRCRLSTGDYGEVAPSRKKLLVNNSGVPLILDANGNLVTATVNTNPSEYIYNVIQEAQEPEPPCLDEILVTYTPPGGKVFPANVVSYNNYYYKDFSGVMGGYQPFEYLADKTPTLYIGFDEPLAELPVTLFFSLLKQDKMSALYTLSSEPPKVFWEYWDNGWKTLQVDDRTEELRVRDIVKFRAPDTLDQCLLFEEELYWIRARLERDEPALVIKADGIYNNVAWANQYITVKKELLGSGNGLPSQQLKFNNKPVLPGEKVYILDEIISDEEKYKYRRIHGEDAVVERYNAFTKKIETWVRWMPVDHFYFSSKDSRHYYIDRINGEITFGDNTFGLIPPKTKNNIECFEYRYGGGEQGNMEIGAVKKLRTSIPYVDAGVNFLPAFGGEKEDTVDSLVHKAPEMLKSGSRAITAEDFIFMVKQASGQVSRVKCLPTTDVDGSFRPGYITLMVLPFSDSEKPLLDEAIIDDIEKYLDERMVFNLKETGEKQVSLINPKYVRCSVDVLIGEYTDINLSLVAENKIKEDLQNYFHANHGGPSAGGWPFGRNVPVSELIQIAEKVEVVSMVSNIAISVSAHQMQFTLNAPYIAGITFPKHSLVEIEIPPRANVPEGEEAFHGKFRYYLPEAVMQGEEVSGIVVMGFKEGDQIIVQTNTSDADIKLDVAGVGFDYLEVERLELSADLEAGLTVKTADGRVESYLLEGVSKDSESTILRIGVPEAPDSRQFLFPRGKLTLIHSRDENVRQKLVCHEISREISSREVIEPMQQFYLKMDKLFETGFLKSSKVQIKDEAAPAFEYYLHDEISPEDGYRWFVCTGFQEGDTVKISGSDPAEFFEAAIERVETELLELKITKRSSALINDIPVGAVIESTGSVVRSYLLQEAPAADIIEGALLSVGVASPVKTDADGAALTSGTVNFVQYGDENTQSGDLDFTNSGGRVSKREEPMKVVFLEDNFLTYSGVHTVEQEGI